jgi:hypothetical protein
VGKLRQAAGFARARGALDRMRRRRLGVGAFVTLVVTATALVVAGSAAAAPQLTGEQTMANFYPCNPGSPSPPALSDCPNPALAGPTPDLTVDVVGGTCNRFGDSTLTVTVDGTASGPFTGTYHETLTWTIGPQTDPAQPAFFPFPGPPAESVGLQIGKVTALTANYTITTGDTTITGTKSLVDNPGGNWGVCRNFDNEPAEGPILNNANLTGAYYILGAGVLSYTAHIVGPGGTTDESGLAATYLNNTYATCCDGTPIQNAGAAGHLREGFEVSFPASGTSNSVDIAGSGPQVVEPLPEVQIGGTLADGGAGSVQAIVTSTAPPLPSGYSVGDPPAYYELTTTATFSGQIEVCIGYGALPGGQTPKLLHYDNGGWVDVTSGTKDPNLVCGLVDHLSPFAAVFQSLYTLTGPFQPVDPLPTVNSVKAGQTVPVKFSLGGDRGLDVFEDGYPTSVGGPCGNAPTDSIETTTNGDGLVYDPATRQYTYHWKTLKSWAGQCRTLTVKFNDGSSQFQASFKFK